MRRFLKISLAAAALCAFAAAPAGAAVTFGSAMLNEPTGAPCATVTEPQSCTYAIGTLPAESQEAGGTVAPIAGVISSWKVKAGPNSSASDEPDLRLRVLRGNTGAGSGPIEELPLGKGIYSYIARLPVQAGDRLGLDFIGVQPGEAPPVAKTMTGATTDTWSPLLADGATLLPSTGTNNDYELMVQATIEPDADKDGWGDETQDKCVGSAGPANGCPGTTVVDPPPPSGPIPTEAVPDTSIGKVTIIAGQKKVTFRFTATVANSSFQCKLDKKPWKPCKSPRTYKGLKGGRHSFKVKAIGPTAVPDPTPAKRGFRLAS